MFTLILIFEGIYGKIEKKSEQISKIFLKNNLKIAMNFFKIPLTRRLTSYECKVPSHEKLIRLCNQSP